MNDLYGWFTGLATIGGFAYFMLGFATAYIVHCARQKVRHREVRIPWHLAGIAVGTVAIIIVSFQSSVAYNLSAKTAQEQRACNIEFRTALLQRSKITRENDELSQEQRRIVFHWIHDLIFPPPPYDLMPTDDPRRQQFGLTRTVETERDFQASLTKQDVLQSERDKHPYPDPTCGN